MMSGTYAGMTAMMIASGVLYLALLTLAVLGIVWLARTLRTGPARPYPVEELRRRYAAGDINDEEYHQRLNGLKTQ